MIKALLLGGPRDWTTMILGDDYRVGAHLFLPQETVRIYDPDNTEPWEPAMKLDVYLYHAPLADTKGDTIGHIYQFKGTHS